LVIKKKEKKVVKSEEKFIFSEGSGLRIMKGECFNKEKRLEVRGEELKNTKAEMPKIKVLRA